MDKKQTQSENHPYGSGMFCPHPPNKSREGHRGKLSPLRGIYSDLITSSGKSLQQVKHSFYSFTASFSGFHLNYYYFLIIIKLFDNQKACIIS